MLYITKAFTILLFLITDPNVLAKSTIQIGTTVSMPPYLYEKEFTGIEIELIKAAFRNQGYTKFLHVDSSYRRAIKLLVEKRVNAIVTNGENRYYSSFDDVYKSQNILNYVDCVITLKSSKEKYLGPKSLVGKRVWAFKSAKKTLGKQYAEAVKSTIEYNETIDQLLQPKALIKKRMEFAVSDRNIFFTQAIKEGLDLKKFKLHELNSKNPRVLRFHNKKLRDIFNNGLAEIRRNGEYNRVLAEYKDLYKSNCT